MCAISAETGATAHHRLNYAQTGVRLEGIIASCAGIIMRFVRIDATDASMSVIIGVTAATPAEISADFSTVIAGNEGRHRRACLPSSFSLPQKFNRRSKWSSLSLENRGLFFSSPARLSPIQNRRVESRLYQLRVVAPAPPAKARLRPMPPVCS